MRKRSTFTVLAAASLLAIPSIVLTTATPAAAASCAGTAPSDFNGDGVSDAAFSEPGGGNGWVHVLYGTRSGLKAEPSGTALDDQLLTSSAGASRIGLSMLAVDLNHDGCTDLVVGDPHAQANVGTGTDFGDGRVQFYWGSPTGLQDSNQTLDESAIAGVTPAKFDDFGVSLAAGNFNGDAYPDLVIGADGDDSDRGAVYIFPGSANLVPHFGGRRFVEGDGTVRGVAEKEDDFGSTVATGDFNNDGLSDLAIGTPGENGGEGAVFVVPGSGTSAMLTATGAQTWQPGRGGVLGSEAGGSFGLSLATGSFRGNGLTDLAIGAPFTNVGSAVFAGAVHVLYSAGTSGLSSGGNQLWTQDSAGVPGVAEEQDGLGNSLAAGDFDGDGKTDLAAGADGETVGDFETGAGAINVFPGSVNGLTATGSTLWDEDTIGGVSGEFDGFANQLATVRVTSAHRDDLLVGAPNETSSVAEKAGFGFLIKSSGSGLTATGAQTWNSDSAAIKGSSSFGSAFGAAIG